MSGTTNIFNSRLGNVGRNGHGVVTPVRNYSKSRAAAGGGGGGGGGVYIKYHLPAQHQALQVV